MGQSSSSDISSANMLANANQNPFPNENIDPSIKNSKEFGLKVSKAIYHKALYTDSIYGIRAKIIENRNYASGKQDIKQYIPMMDAAIENAGDKSYLNIDWSISSPAPKIVNLIVGDMMNQEYKVQFNAIDSKSRTRKESARDEYFGKMVRKKTVQEFEARTGAVLESLDGFVPKDQEELDMYMEMDFKEAIEIAMEDIVDWTFWDNDFNQIKTRIFHDLVENNKGALRIYWDENFNIRCRYVDIGNLITSYTDDPYYNDTEYEGEVYKITIRELRNLSNGYLSEEELFKIAEMSADKLGNPKWNFQDAYSTYDWGALTYSFDDYRIEVLDFVYYTTDVNRYEEKTRPDGRVYFNKKNLSYKQPEKTVYQHEVIDKKTQQAYSGMWVVNTDYMVKYSREKNITRPKREGKPSPKMLKKYVIIEPNKRYGTSNSIIDLIKPSLDDIQLSVLRCRHFKAEAAPPGLAIEIESINSMNVGDGKKDMTPLQLIKLFKQKGIVLFSRLDDNGEAKNGKPIEQLTNGIMDGLRPLMDDIMFQLARIEDITGINNARDGSRPSKDALVGIQKLQLIASNNVTRELYNAFVSILERSGLVFSRMIQDKIKYAQGGIDQYIPIIGQQAVKTLSFIPEDMSLADFGIKAEALPTGEELQDIINAVNDAVGKGEIRFEDGMEIKSLAPKKAIKYLKFRKKQYQDELAQQEATSAQINAQREQASIQAAAEKERIKQMAIEEKEKNVLTHQYQLMTEYDNNHTENQIKTIQWEGRNKEQEIKVAAEMNLDNTESENPLQRQPKVFPSV